jgi:hypothetical protein
VVANLWAASSQGIQLGYEGFAPDDADPPQSASWSRKRIWKSNSWPASRAPCSTAAPITLQHLEARLGGGVAVGEVIDEDDRQREAERNAQELGGRQAEDPAN